MPAHVLHGDSFLVPKRLVNLSEESGASDVVEANHHHLLASQAKPDELLSMSNALPFMDDYRLIVVEGLLGTAESQGRGRRRDSSSGPKVAAPWQTLGDSIPKMPRTTILIFTDGLVSENNPMLRILKPVSKVEELSATSGEALDSLVNSKVSVSYTHLRSNETES